MRYFFFMLLILVVSSSKLHAGVILDLNGTTSNPTITASVDNGDVFTSAPGGIIDFFLLPNAFDENDVNIFVHGQLGLFNPFQIRAPLNGSHLNLIRISSGDRSSFTLDQSNPISSSSFVSVGNITDASVLDGVTSFMLVDEGTGPTTNVTLNYNLTSVPEPSTFSLVLISLGSLGLWRTRRRKTV